MNLQHDNPNQYSSGLLRLLQLCSANFPVGAYAFSQGLEWAVEAEWITDIATFNHWLDDQLYSGMTHLDIPILYRILDALSESESRENRFLRLNHWNSLLLANRETQELRAAELAMGEAATRVARELEIAIPKFHESATFVAVFALFAYHWRIDSESAVQGYLWTWLENQVSAAIKLIPLGQSQAQRVLDHNSPKLAKVIQQARPITNAEIGASLPGVAIASALHETQYTRLFRS